jgi:hypothetical protein
MRDSAKVESVWLKRQTVEQAHLAATRSPNGVSKAVPNSFPNPWQPSSDNPPAATSAVSSISAAQIARLKLEQAQAALVRASLTEYQTPRLAKDIAEARLAGDTAAITRAELQFADRELVRVEARFKEELASLDEVEKARSARDTAAAQSSEEAARAPKPGSRLHDLKSQQHQK